jgi:hypothetical protein
MLRTLMLTLKKKYICARRPDMNSLTANYGRSSKAYMDYDNQARTGMNF